MNEFKTCCLAVWVALSLTQFYCAHAADVNEGYPSKIYSASVGKGQDARFALHEISDMRLLFCDRPVLKDRMRRSICVVDDARKTIATDDRASAKEVQLIRSISVARLLKKIDMSKWNGDQPQLRIVKRNAIIQSPLIGDTAAGKPDINSFLNQRIEPGDFLIITPSN